MSNAVARLVALLPAPLVARRLERESLSRRGAHGDRARRLARTYELDLVGFLNGASDDELAALIASLKLPAKHARYALWSWGAALERRALGHVEISARVQPAPTLRHGKLVLPRRARAAAKDGVLPTARAARFPPSPSWPRPVPPAIAATPCDDEPDTIDALLARADAILGVRLGVRPRDKGWYGQRISDLLGLPRSSSPSPDWRGEVELKTIAVVPAAGAAWRIKDGPAISMRGVDARAKLSRVVWIVRAEDVVLSWFYQELDAELTRALEHARHLRPKGGANTTGRGWYLRRAYFEACGLMRSLNG